MIIELSFSFIKKNEIKDGRYHWFIVESGLSYTNIAVFSESVTLYCLEYQYIE